MGLLRRLWASCSGSTGEKEQSKNIKALNYMIGYINIASREAAQTIDNIPIEQNS